MDYYKIERIQHRYKDGSLVRPVFHVVAEGGSVFSDSREDIAKDVQHLLNKAHRERLDAVAQEIKT